MSTDETLPVGGLIHSDRGRRYGETASPRDVEYPPNRTMGPEPSFGDYEAESADRTQIWRQAPKVMAWLVFTGEAHYGALHRLSTDPTGLGRDSHNDLILDGAEISRQHAKIKYEKSESDREQFFIYDLASTSGTLVNGVPVLKEALFDGDKIEIGHVCLVFKQINGPRRPAKETAAEGSPKGQEGC